MTIRQVGDELCADNTINEAHNAMTEIVCPCMPCALPVYAPVYAPCVPLFMPCALPVRYRCVTYGSMGHGCGQQASAAPRDLAAMTIIDHARRLCHFPPMVQFSAPALFDWYDTHGRQLPWRRRWPELAPAYHVWLSEIMLQQTIVATVIPYFLEFTRRWPDVRALANAPLDDVLAAWAGLGYYARARNLHKAAIVVAEELDGVFPSNYADLLALPGIGPYTAGAISVIGFGQRGTVVDGNIERVMARQFAITTPLPAAKREIGAMYEDVLPDERPSDFPQALMDFANAVCTVRAPVCAACPLAASCQGLAADIVQTLPVKAPKKTKETRRGIAFVVHDGAGSALLVRRAETGMLGGMLAFPSAGWANRAEQYDPDADLNLLAPFAADWRLLDTPVAHVFTHFALDMDIAVARRDMAVSAEALATLSGTWERVRPASLPTLMRKVWKAAEKAR